MKPKIAFIGSGRMASAMVKGIISQNVYLPGEIICTSAKDGTAEALASETGISCTYDANTLLDGTDFIVLACKPQQLSSLPPELTEKAEGKVVISILAGTTIARLKEKIPAASNWVRVMPNTPGQIQAGVSAFAFAKEETCEIHAKVVSILSALGVVLNVEEKDLDAVTGLSGSGPAYVFEFVAGLRDAGIARGLDPDVAYTLAVETVLGAAKLLREVPETPETHRNWVSSPGGTTLAGLAIMEERGFRSIIHDTVAAATRRSEELAQS